MQFRPQEIDMAHELRRLGLPWEPRAGHYVYDETGFCSKGSPFQDGVYFMRASASMANLGNHR
jgi:hypothetical protein